MHAGKVLPANHPVVKARPDGGPYVGLLGRLGPRPGIVLDSDHVAIALVDSLIDRLIQLVEWRKHRRTALLTNLVEPTCAMFEEVHANYLKRFRGYREEIQSPDADIRRLIDTIATDALFAAGDRAKLLESANVIDDETVGAFVESVVQYLGWPRGNVAPETFGVQKGTAYVINIWAEEALHLMSPLSDRREPALKEATEIIDQVVRGLQDAHGRVVHEYETLRTSLIR